MDNTIVKLTYKDFEKAFDDPLTDYVKKSIDATDFRYTNLTKNQNEEMILMIVKTLLEGNPVKAGESRINEWDDGWGENLNLLKSDEVTIENLTPKYFNKYNVVRLNGKFIRPVSEQFEKNTLGIILDWLFEKYFTKASHIYEFGCGTGHNLLRSRRINKDAQLWGLDWARSSQEIINTVRENGIDANIYSHNFDYYRPDYDFKLAPDSIVYTVASLEQVGDKWDAFVNYLIEQKPKLCVHIEPVAELLSQDKLLDYLSVQYFIKRNYLSGFLSGLKDLEKKNKIKIIDAKRNNIGSLFIEGYSVVIWQPI